MVYIGSTRGYTHYELTNHLGNVLAVITDRKMISTGAFYVSDVLSLTDYYAFGQAITERTYNASAYRYSINGQEKDTDIDPSGNHTTALYWEYDSRTGRRWNLYPVVKEWESPYMCFGDNPITGSNVLGNTTKGLDGQSWIPKVEEKEVAGKKIGYLSIEKRREIILNRSLSFLMLIKKKLKLFSKLWIKKIGFRFLKKLRVLSIVKFKTA